MFFCFFIIYLLFLFAFLLRRDSIYSKANINGDPFAIHVDMNIFKTKGRNGKRKMKAEKGNKELNWPMPPPKFLFTRRSSSTVILICF